MSKRKKERTQAQVIVESLIKMQKYLERKGIASSRVELERKTIIQIAGIDKKWRGKTNCSRIKRKIWK